MIFTCLIIALVPNPTFSQGQSCSELFSQHYGGCEAAHQSALAVATANLVICMGAGATNPVLAPGSIAACTGSYIAAASVADSNFYASVEMATTWYLNCVEW